MLAGEEVEEKDEVEMLDDLIKESEVSPELRGSDEYLEYLELHQKLRVRN